MARRTDIKAAKKAVRKEENKKALKRERTLTQIKIAGIAVVAVAIVAAVIVGINALVKSSKTAYGSYMRDTVVVKNSYGEVDAAMIAFYIGEEFNHMIDSSDDNTLAIMGIERDKKPSELIYDGSTTWFDTLASEACDDAAEWLAYCLAAKNAGFDLSDDDIDAIQKRAERVDLSRYPSGLTLDDVVRAMKINALGEKYKAVVTADNTVSVEELEKEINNNKNKYYTLDYRYYYIAYEVEQESDFVSDISEQTSETDLSEEAGEESGEETVVLSYEDALAEAAKLASSKDEREFIDNVANFMVAYFSAFTEENVKESAAEYVEKDIAVGDATLSKWLYDTGRKVGDTEIFDTEDGVCMVVMITSLPEYNAGKDTVNISYIRTYDEATAKLAAEYAANGGNAFEEACIIYSNNTDCYTGGKLVDYVGAIKNEELNAWLFGGDAEVGELMVVKGANGWYVVRYDGEGVGSVKSSLRELLSKKAVAAAYEKVVSEGRVSVTSSGLNVIDY